MPRTWRKKAGARQPHAPDISSSGFGFLVRVLVAGPGAVAGGISSAEGKAVSK
ncbi:hypothetical protein GCM10023085_75590 [Actinomadura viridis]